MITILKLYKSTIIVNQQLLINDKKNLLNIQLSIIRKIVKAPNSTPKISLYGERYGEIGELPIDFIKDKMQTNHVT